MSGDDTRSQDSDFSALWSSDGVTRSLSPMAGAIPADLPFLFSSGQRFGSYVIVRPLGKGGMGQVYEAEESDSGRRVAVKLLSRGLGDDEERDRFLQEGRLAASLSHPNCVYVFGTSEIQGFPVIAMELVPRGTLKELIVPGQPMSLTTAVDAILQVIDGLEAAAAIGILHRDIKPSNCFVHDDGRVLVGDFGLSVATTSRDAQGGQAHTILGTPGFASPEQLRGDALDVRSDIYSVGATLFYLLAGRAPFDDQTTTSLLEKVATTPPPLVTSLRPELPRSLAAIVAKCLAKTPAERYASYPALRAALEPFGSAVIAHAPIVRRTAAGVLDSWLTGLLLAPVTLLLRLQSSNASHQWDGPVLAMASVTIALVYYGVQEGFLGTTAGKALFGLRVIDAHQAAPGGRRAAMRALVFEGPSQVLKQVSTLLLLKAIPDLNAGFISVVAGIVWLIVLFAMSRKSNGWTALHDRVTKTRVVRRKRRAEAREREVRTPAEMSLGPGSGIRIGPYSVAARPAAVSEPIRIDGFDDRLKRRVWIELLPAATPPLSAARRDLGRSTRLRWLGGRRDGADCWDAYEAVDGIALDVAIADRQPWSKVRHWLADLVREIPAGLADGSLPPLHPGRAWLGRDGHVRVLEWCASGGREDAASPDLASSQRFMNGVCVAALTGLPFETAKGSAAGTPLPLGARTALLSLRDARFTSAQEMADAVDTALTTPVAITRARRAVQMMICAALPVLLTLISLGGILFVSRSKTGADRTLLMLDACLNELQKADKKLKKGPDAQAEQRRRDVGVYLAEHFAGTIEDPRTWEASFPNVGRNDGRNRAKRAVDAHRERTPEEVRRAEA